MASGVPRRGPRDTDRRGWLKHLFLLYGYVRGRRMVFLFVLFCTVASPALMLLFPWWAKSLLAMLPTSDFGVLAGHMVLGVLIYFGFTAARYGCELALRILSRQIAATLREDMFSRILRAPFASGREAKSGDLLSRLSHDIVELQSGLTSGLAVVLPSAVASAVLLVGMIWYSWRLTLSAAFISVPVVAAIWYFGGRIRWAGHRAQEAKSPLMALLEEAILGEREIKSFVREDMIRGRYREISRASLAAEIAQVKVIAAHPVSVNVLYAIAVGAMILSCAWLYARADLAGPDIVAFFTCALLFAQPFEQVNRYFGSASRLFAVLDRCVEVLDAPVEEADEDLPAMPDLSGRIRFENVSFCYEPGVHATRDIAVDVREGETLAIVGPSGAGKTTLLNLLLGFVVPSEGKILLDGHDSTDYSRRSLRRQIGFVPQEPMLFEGTLRENVLFGDPGASDQELIAVSRSAHVHEFAARLPDGYDTLVGARGSALSAGQRQRVAVARALLKDPRILLLDEPTSALDSESERLVQDAVRVLTANRTTLIVAHRMSTIKHADRIVVMDRGGIVEAGTHESLLAAGGMYSRLFMSQVFLGEAGGR